MKVILLRDVARLGRKSEVKDVPDGHAINFLIPRKLAVIATPESMKRVVEVAGKQASIVASTVQQFKEAIEKSTQTPIVCTVDANEQGHLFKGIRADDIATVLNANGFSITKQNVVLDAPIKSLGVHAVSLVQGSAKGIVQLEVVKK